MALPLSVSPTFRKINLGLHLFFSGVWFSSGMAMIMIQVMLASHASGGDELYAYMMATKLIDDFMVIPGALGSLITGLVISLTTNWGFFRHHWVTIKWIVTVGSVIFGTFWLGPWLNGATEIADTIRAAAFNDPDFNLMRAKNLGAGSVQVGLLVVLVFLSALKPWSRKKKKPA